MKEKKRANRFTYQLRVQPDGFQRIVTLGLEESNTITGYFPSAAIDKPHYSFKLILSPLPESTTRAIDQAMLEEDDYEK
jgi:hypothetical protein